MHLKNMKASSKFYSELTKILLKNLKYFHGADNWDIQRFGKRRLSRPVILESILFRLNILLQRYGFSVIAAKDISINFDRVMTLYGEGLSNIYSMLADEYSKHALVELVAYRLLGYRHMKLWTNTPAYWEKRAIATSLPKENSEIETGIDIMRLAKTDLHPIGYPITLFTRPPTITNQFLLTQYAYEQIDPPIWLSEGEYVIDAGAAWGDTALRFAYEIGESGRVFAFEFEPKNIEILTKNLNLNPTMASRIRIVKNALWHESSLKLNFTSKGPGTNVTEYATGQSDNQITSISIDKFAESLPRVDFIKMDIEGAELNALKGAEQTIRKHRPKMAISLYHNLSDFVNIPAHLASLGLDYNYYIDHTTIHAEETILFAAPRQRIG